MGQFFSSSPSLHETYEDITKATVSTLAVPVAIVAYPLTNAYAFKEAEITGHKLIDGTIGGLLGVIACKEDERWELEYHFKCISLGPLAPFFAVWTAFTCLFNGSAPPFIAASEETLAEAKEKIGLDTINFYNVAVVGSSGTGKSFIVNAIRGHMNTGKGSARVGETETTRKPTGYHHPYFKNLMIWDMPGVGTSNHSINTYFDDNYLTTFDLLIMVVGNRLLTNEWLIANEAQKLNMSLIYVRTKIDNRYGHDNQDTKAWSEALYQLEKEEPAIINDGERVVLQYKIDPSKFFIISGYTLYDFVTTMAKGESTKDLVMVHEARFLAAVLNGVRSKRKYIKNATFKDAKKHLKHLRQFHI
ncbi:interferon-inducible GTPase-domain-containing protein [Pilobolus umbonatus]|nr:interferon-inducible GTPase-domain-containing protein [Pilobolus umbonatus]